MIELMAMVASFALPSLAPAGSLIGFAPTCQGPSDPLWGVGGKV